jgi:hypothetical protein
MPDKYEFYVQGAMAHRTNTHSSNRHARNMFKLAIAEDDSFARAWGFLSYTQIIAYLNDWKSPGNDDDNDVDPEIALNNADEAVSKASSDYETLWSLATAQVFNKQVETGITTYDAALDLADAGGQADSFSLSTLKAERADALMFKGGADNIREAIDVVMNLPTYRSSFAWTLGWAYYELAGYERRNVNATASLGWLKRFSSPPALVAKNLAATYVALRMTKEAREAAEFFRTKGYDPEVAEEKWPHLQDRETRLRRWKDHLIAAL